MQKITNRKKLFLYGCSGLGVNMLNLIVASYLCSALRVGGFDEHIEAWTYLNKDLVVPVIWSVMVLAAKILDGVIDVPLSSFTDRLKTRWGRRRPSIVIGFVPMLIAYLLFLIVPSSNNLVNTIWFGVLLCVYFTSYTLTMLTYYATFAEITANESDTVFLSNVKSICDVIYFSLGYALIPVFINLNINIRYIALMFLPLSLLMIIPLFLLKEQPTKVTATTQQAKAQQVGDCVTNEAQTPYEPQTDEIRQAHAPQVAATTAADTANDTNVAAPMPPLKLGAAIAQSFKNKTFLYWMLTAAMMNIGLQLFLGGINELFSSVGVNQAIVMATSFAPVPFTILLYNKLVKKFGLGMAYKYILAMFSVGMAIMFVCGVYSDSLSKTTLTIVAILGGIFASFAIGGFFSVSYTVPSHLAQVEFDTKGISVSSMYFAVEGLIEGIAAGIATGPILNLLKGNADKTYILYLPIVVVAACLIAFAMSFAFPTSIAKMGKITALKADENA